jgi:hypothetical protein
MAQWGGVWLGCQCRSAAALPFQPPVVTLALLGELRVVAGIAHHRFVQGWIAVLRHLLIDATAEHQITPQQQLEG